MISNDNKFQIRNLWQSCCKYSIYVFSNPAAVKQLPHHDGCYAGPKIGNITFSQADIEETIDDMNRDASSTDHDIPALILKECKNNISYPVFIVWKESFESEVIPEDMKIQSITPIFKRVKKSNNKKKKKDKKKVT